MSASKIALSKSLNSARKIAELAEYMFVGFGTLCPISLFLSFWGMWSEDTSSPYFFWGGIFSLLVCVVGIEVAMRSHRKASRITRFLAETKD